MKRVSEEINIRRTAKRISLKKASGDLHIKREILENLEKGNWEKLPEPTYIKGILRSYTSYLGMDTDQMLALFRREFDETKYPQKAQLNAKQNKFIISPNTITKTAFGIIITLAMLFIMVQYFSLLKSPKLEVVNPPNNLTTTVPVVIISGSTEKDATIAIEGEFVPVDQNGQFQHEAKLEEGRNVFTIIAAKKLSPKTKVSRIIRLSP